MATRVIDEFGSRANAPDAAYPDGSLKNETTPGVSNDGSPLDERVGNDWEGFKQSALSEASVTANGQPDSVTNPQILDSLKSITDNRFNYDGVVYTGLGNISSVAGQQLAEVNKLNAYQFPDDSRLFYGAKQDQVFPITIPADPSIDNGWALVSTAAQEWVVKTIGNKNELSNSNFLIPSQDAITQPNPTPESYTAGTQIFSGVYAGVSGCTITLINGRVNCTAGDYQFKLPNTSGLKHIPVFTSTVSDYDGIPKTTGVSHVLVGDEYIVTVTPSAGEVFSVKLEQGSVATRHEVVSLFDIYGDPSVTNVVKVKAYGVVGNGSTSDTDAMIRAVADVKSGMVIDLQGLNVNLVHKGVNNNPAGTPLPNKTSFLVFEKLKNISIINGSIETGVDLTSLSHHVLSFWGCENVVIDISINQSCSGYPVYLDNNFETEANLIEFRHHPDGTIGKGLTIASSCKFRNHHPDGYSIGDGTGNPVHPTYAGKLMGLEFWGDFDQTNPVWMDDLLIEDGVEFYDTTARCIWCWTYRDVIIGDVTYRNCGTSTLSECYFGPRLIHGGRNVKIGVQSFIDCYIVIGVYLANNNGPHTPKNVIIDGVSMINCEGLAATQITDGENVQVGNVLLENSPMERGAYITTTGFNKIKNLTIDRVYGSGTLGRLVDIRGDLLDKVTVKSVYAKWDGSQDMSGIFGVYVENYTSTGGSKLSLDDLHLVGFQSGIFCDSTSTVPFEIGKFTINNCIGDGIVFTTLSGQGSGFYDGTLNDNGGVGMRLPRGSFASNIKGINNNGELVQLMSNSVLDGYRVDDGTKTSSSSSAISIVPGEVDWVIKGGTLKSSEGRFEYGINANQVGSILRNDFLGSVGTTAKWLTFGGTNVQYNTPTDTPAN